MGTGERQRKIDEQFLKGKYAKCEFYMDVFLCSALLKLLFKLISAVLNHWPMTFAEETSFIPIFLQ